MRKRSKFPLRKSFGEAGKAQSPRSAKKAGSLTWFFLFLTSIFLYMLFANLRNSAFFQKKDRLNIVTSAENIFYYSLGLSENVNYFIPFYPDLEVEVPGGYGHYRLGALPKLASLEEKPEIIKKTYSLATSSVIDFYFYPGISADRMQVFFGDKPGNFAVPNFSLLFFGVSNANFFDRLYIYFHFLGKTEGQFRVIEDLNTVLRGNRKAFSSGEFFEAAQGIFYKKTYRSEKRTVQIVYTDSYKTAQQIGQILEGEGIRIADLSQSEEKSEKCLVIEEGGSFSATAVATGKFFGCQLAEGNAGAYDIILKLGKLEEEWEIQ